jgi:hypothetical protein
LRALDAIGKRAFDCGDTSGKTMIDAVTYGTVPSTSPWRLLSLPIFPPSFLLPWTFPRRTYSPNSCLDALAFFVLDNVFYPTES